MENLYLRPSLKKLFALL